MATGIGFRNAFQLTKLACCALVSKLQRNVLTRLHAGHYGIVRRGIRRSDGARVAVKTIPKRRAIYVEMLRNEISILQSLNCANIIKLYDQFEDSKQAHLVFEYCAGGELIKPVVDQAVRFTERQAARIVRQMMDAVKYCHDRHIVHRDLKPDNMLLTSSSIGLESELKVIDFGLATHIRFGEVLTKHVGTPYYIAPEVLEKNYGKPCDMWSIGVITFAILYGYPPFWGDNEKEVYIRIRRGRYAFDEPHGDARSAHSKDFIHRLLVQDPVRRLTVDDALAHQWIVCEGEVIDPRSTTIISTYTHTHTFLLVTVLIHVLWLQRGCVITQASRGSNGWHSRL
jgi:calcium-dependent protein kinase